MYAHRDNTFLVTCVFNIQGLSKRRFRVVSIQNTFYSSIIINYYTIFHINNYKSTFALPCSDLSLERSLTGTLGKEKIQSFMTVDAEMQQVLGSIANCMINSKVKAKKVMKRYLSTEMVKNTGAPTFLKCALGHFAFTKYLR